MKITLSNGVQLETRIVPPYAQAKLVKQFPEPDAPVHEVQSKAGHIEEMTFGEESAEWLEWAKARAEIREQFSEALMNLALDYGVIRWRNVPSQVWWQRWLWQKDAPKDWGADEVLARYGVVSGHSRVEYLQLEIIATSADLVAVLDATLGTPISEDDVAAATDSFPDGGAPEVTA